MELNVKFLGFGVCARYLVTSWQIGLYMKVWMGGGVVWYSPFIKNLAHYSSHLNFGLFIKIRPIIH